MYGGNEKLDAGRVFRFTAKAAVGSIIALGFTVLLSSCTKASVPQAAGQTTFPSAEVASQALFLATQSGNEQAVMHILGGGKELVSTGDKTQDNLDREQFAQKYEQMHRLVRQSDGATQLYIGAENWPFPIPLVSSGKVWYFDATAGAQEIRFRRVGENEYTAIEICHALVQASRQPGNTSTEVDPVTQYARAIINLQRTQPAGTPPNEDEVAGPFHGYYFRILTAQGKARGVPSSASAGIKVVAYPADYRSSGVMTFLVVQDDVVYERDLGPNTADVQRGITSRSPTSNWDVAE